MSVSHYNEITELPSHFFKELKNFFEDYQKLENKTVQVDNFKNADVANTIVDKIMVDNQNYIKEMSDMG